ncbi:MAG: hypothetical protein ACTSRP_01265 [Candidatus Helarchaeota archaeon]
MINDLPSSIILNFDKLAVDSVSSELYFRPSYRNIEYLKRSIGKEIYVKRNNYIIKNVLKLEKKKIIGLTY